MSRGHDRRREASAAWAALLIISAGATTGARAQSQPPSERNEALRSAAAAEPGAAPEHLRRPSSNGSLERLTPHAGAPAARPVTALDLGAAFGVVSRGGCDPPGGGGGLATMDTGFESLAPLPANLVNQLDTVTWGGASSSVTGRNHFSAATDGWTSPGYGIVTDAIGGNATKKLRGFVVEGQGSPSPFFGRFARYNLFRTNGVNPGQGDRYVFAPTLAHDAKASHDTFVTAIASLWTSEPTYVSSGFIVGRLLWGGENATTGIGLPTGAIPDFYAFGPPDPWSGAVFYPCLSPAFYRSGAPFPGGAGQYVPVPIGTWFRIIHETTPDGRLRHVLDLHDGNGEFVIWDEDIVTSSLGRLDRLAWSGDQAVTGDAMYLDDIQFEGAEYLLPVPPPRACLGGQFFDDQCWLFDGALIGQSTEYVDFLSSRAEVLAVGDARNPFTTRAIFRENWAPDDRYRKEIHRLLPETVASPIGPFRLCNTLHLPNPPYATVQAIAPVSVTDGDFVSRMLIGRATGPISQGYTSRVYVQINRDYNPIDDEATVNPFFPGPSGNGAVPVIGTDIADTGVNWAFSSDRTVCFDVDSARNLTVSINAVNIHTGQAFVNSIDRLDFESENNSGGSLNQIVYDDIVLTCAVLPPVTLPPLSLVYNDNLEWGFEGVSIDLHDDDGNPSTPFRWSAPPGNMPIVSLNVDDSSKVLRMENLFRDTPASLPLWPEFFQFTQASTALPSVAASSTRGWAAKSSAMLTDTETSRTWSVASATIDPNSFARVGGLAFSSVTDTFWVQTMNGGTPDPSDTTFFDTGAGLSAFGLGLNQWFSVSMHKSPAGPIHWRIGAISHGAPSNATEFLRFTGGANDGQVVLVDSLFSLPNGVHRNMDRYYFHGSDEDTAPVGSILYADNIRAWSLPCLGDTNNDGLVDFGDLNNVLSFFGASSTSAAGVNLIANVAPDANNDNIPDNESAGGPGTFLYRVNFTDVNAVLSGFGQPCTATN